MSKKSSIQPITAEQRAYTTELELWQALSAEAKLQNAELYISCDSFAFCGYVTDLLFDKYLVLTGAKWVFSTGAFTDKSWADAQPVPRNQWHVALDKIESFGILK